MPKLKTHRGAAKRFKKTGTGKFTRSMAFKRHPAVEQDDASVKRHLSGTVVVADVDAAEIKRMLPYK